MSQNNEYSLSTSGTIVTQPTDIEFPVFRNQSFQLEVDWIKFISMGDQEKWHTWLANFDKALQKTLIQWQSSEVFFLIDESYQSCLLACSLHYLQKSQDLPLKIIPLLVQTHSTPGWTYEVWSQVLITFNFKAHHFPLKFIESAVKRLFEENYTGQKQSFANEPVFEHGIKSMAIKTFYQLRPKSLFLGTSNCDQFICNRFLGLDEGCAQLHPLVKLLPSETKDLFKAIKQTNYATLIQGSLEKFDPSEGQNHDKTHQSKFDSNQLSALRDFRAKPNSESASTIRSLFKAQQLKKVYGLYQKTEYKGC